MLAVSNLFEEDVSYIVYYRVYISTGTEVAKSVI